MSAGAEIVGTMRLADIRKMATALALRFDVDTDTREDLIQSGCLAGIMAARRYRPGGAKCSTYVYPAVWGGIVSEAWRLQSLVYVPQVQCWRNGIYPPRVMLDSLVENRPDRFADTCRSAMRGVLKKTLLTVLSELEVFVVVMHASGETLRGIAKARGFSPQRAHEVYHRAWAKLRAYQGGLNVE